MNTTPSRRFLDGILKAFGRCEPYGWSRDRSAFLAEGPPPDPEEEAVSPAAPVWASPAGEIMQARWKGQNAKVWWPLKEQTQIVVVKKVDGEAALCEGGKALFQFSTQALLQFIHIDDLGRAGHMKDLGNRLRVEVAGYQIVSAVLVPREQARPSKKGIA